MAHWQTTSSSKQLKHKVGGGIQCMVAGGHSNMAKWIHKPLLPLSWVGWERPHNHACWYHCRVNFQLGLVLFQSPALYQLPSTSDLGYRVFIPSSSFQVPLLLSPCSQQVHFSSASKAKQKQSGINPLSVLHLFLGSVLPFTGVSEADCFLVHTQGPRLLFPQGPGSGTSHLPGPRPCHFSSCTSLWVSSILHTALATVSLNNQARAELLFHPLVPPCSPPCHSSTPFRWASAFTTQQNHMSQGLQLPSNGQSQWALVRPLPT